VGHATPILCAQTPSAPLEQNRHFNEDHEMMRDPRRDPRTPIDRLGLVSPEDAASLREWIRSWDAHPRPVVFAGAGLSAYNAVRKPGAPNNAVIKAWDALAADFTRALQVEGFSQLPGDPLRLAQLVERQTSRTGLLDIVEAAVPEQHFDPGPAHEALTRLPLAAVVTTNYDDLIERAYASTRFPTLAVIDDTDLARARTGDRTLLIKMHGDLRRRPSIVISEDDYRRYEQRPDGRPGIALKVRQLLLEHPILFIGYGLSDPNVNLLLGWVRDTLGSLQLPAIAIVHSRPRRAERDLWSARGIHLVECQKVPGALGRLLRAIREERTYQPGPPNIEKRHHEVLLALQQILLNGPESPDAAREAVLQFLDVADPLLSSPAALQRLVIAVSTPWTLDGKPTWGPVLAHLPLETLTALARVFATGTRHFIPEHGRGVDLRVALFAFGAISEEERASWFLNWLDDQLDGAEPEQLKSWLDQLRAWRDALSETARARLDEAIGDIVYIRADEADVRLEASRATPPTVRDLCRAACALLVLDDRKGAMQRFKVARDMARSAEDRYVALLGLLVCEDETAVAEELGDIVSEERPGSTRIERIRDDAANAFLKKGNELYAAPRLIEYCREARRAHWPVQYAPVQNAALRATQLLLAARDSGASEISRAIHVRIEFGIFSDVGRDFEFEQVDRLRQKPQEAAQVRATLLRTGLMPAAHATQQAIATMASDLLSDEEIVTLVDSLARESRCVDASDRQQWERLDSRWEALQRARQRLPFAAQVAVADVVPDLGARIGRIDKYCDTFDVSMIPASALRREPALLKLIEWVTEKCADPDVLRDWLRRRPVLRLAEQLSALVNETQSAAIKRNALAAMANVRKEKDDDSLLLEVYGVLATDDDGHLNNDEVGAALAGLGQKVKRSSLSHLWSWNVEQFGPRAGAKVRATLRATAFAVASASLKLRATGDDDLFAATFEPVRPLRALVALIEASRRNATEAEVTLIRQVAAVRPEAWGLFARLRIGTDEKGRVFARDALIRSAIQRKDGRGAAHGIVEWCCHQQPDDAMLDLLVGLIVLGDQESRVMTGALARMRAAGKLKKTAWERVARHLLEVTRSAGDSLTRAQAAYNLPTAAKGTRLEDEAAVRLKELASDPVTIIRRAAQRAMQPERMRADHATRRARKR
jgi:hypothetical protein